MKLKLQVIYAKGDCSALKKSFMRGMITAGLALEVNKNAIKTHRSR